VDVAFLQAVKGIAPGQSAVFYEGDDVIAGGIIR
jgi:tRNA-specific 2-thiouridylase